jgi:hypothetical protein
MQPRRGRPAKFDDTVVKKYQTDFLDFNEHGMNITAAMKTM